MTRQPGDIADELLVLRAKGGDRWALETLVRRWHPRLTRHARRLCDDTPTADDAVQEAWAAIVRRIRSIADPARFGPWAYRIVTNKCADQVRRRRRDRKLHRSVNRSTPAHDPTPADEIDDLRAALRRLSGEQRALLSLFYTDGLSVAQIGAALGIPPGTVKSRLFAARAELKRAIERSSDAEH